MKSEIKYELPIFSSTLEKDPIIEIKNLDMKIELIGSDEENRIRKVSVCFNTVICNKHTDANFTPVLFGSYDKIVELINSEWLEELRNINQEEFNFWNPKHYVLYLDDIGMFQFIAKGFEVIEDE